MKGEAINNKIDPIKVVWICGFSNLKIGGRFGFDTFEESAPWINNMISLFENREDVEIHIIAPNIYTNSAANFIENRICFHLYQYTWRRFKRVHNKLRINEFSNFYFQRLRISRIIKTIKPDILHLHGAENPIYSTSILDNYTRFQSLVTIQGFINHEIKVENYFIRKRKAIEIKILQTLTHFGVRTNDMCNVITEFNPRAVFHWHNYPITKPEASNNYNDSQYKYDCVCFARISVENGIEDFLKAISIVKMNFEDIRCALIGPLDDSYKKHLLGIIKKLGITKNVQFTGYFKSQQLAFNEIALSKMDVLCTYYDIIPGTILESMQIGTPVISYAVGGIPELNHERETLLLVEKGNIHQLAESILKLLNDQNYRKYIAKNAKVTVEPYFNDEKIYCDLLQIYHNLNSINKK